MRLICFALLLGLTMTFDPRPLPAQQPAAESKSDGEAFLDDYREAATERWEEEIRKLETKDRERADPPDPILFIGSSSIRRWDSIVTDMAPYKVIQRGYGGSKFSNVAVFARRLIEPHEYRAMGVFVANDVVGKPTDHSLEQIELFVRHIIRVSKSHQPSAPVFLIEVTPTARRWEAWPKIRQVNALLRELALTTPGIHFIATADYYLDPQGQPRTELFVEDQLHLNEAGYDLWSRLIRRRIDDVLRMRADFEADKAD